VKTIWANLGRWAKPGRNRAGGGLHDSGSVRPECSRDATNCWRCPDGRLLAGQNDPECDIHYSAPQTGGGIGMTDTSVELMINKTPEPVAKLLATKTRRAVLTARMCSAW